MGKLRTVTVVFDEGDMVVAGYYTPAYRGTNQTPPEPALFEVTDAVLHGVGNVRIDFGELPRELLAEDVWHRLGELARREVEQRDEDERAAYAERDE